jgi:hypothetical protein
VFCFCYRQSPDRRGASRQGGLAALSRRHVRHGRHLADRVNLAEQVPGATRYEIEYALHDSGID